MASVYGNCRSRHYLTVYCLEVIVVWCMVRTGDKQRVPDWGMEGGGFGMPDFTVESSGGAVGLIR